MQMIYLFLFFISCSALVQAVPAQVVLIRHAEKPENGDSLSKEGFARAAALVPFFTLSPTVAPFAEAAAVYAPCSSKNHGSTRAIQTVSALANIWAVPFYVKFTVADIKLMVAEIMSEPSFQDKMVLIAWEHARLPDIAQAFGVDSPPAWPGNVYDRVWVINFVGNKVGSFQNLPQQLMFGDSAN